MTVQFLIIVCVGLSLKMENMRIVFYLETGGYPSRDYMMTPLLCPVIEAEKRYLVLVYYLLVGNI